MDQTVHRRNLAARMLLAVVVMVALLSAGSPVFAAPTATYTLTGKITFLDGVTPVPDATVIALQAGALKQTANTDPSGNYSITLPTPGDWGINIIPNEPVPTTSPTWVYTGGVAIDTIVADPGNAPLNLMVILATSTVTGTLLVPVPDAGATFVGGNIATVRVANQEGLGNTVRVASDGSFSVNVLPGNIVIHVGIRNDLWAPDPTLAGSVWTFSSGTNPIPVTSPNPLQLLKKQAMITGTVLDELGHAAKGIPVRAWRLDASEAETTTSSLADGSYSLNVVNGIWEIWAVPSPAQPFVSADSPKTVILATPTSVKADETLNVITADVTVSGQVVDQNGVAISPAPDGRVIPTYLDKDGVHWRQFTNGTPITSGTYTLKLSSALSKHYRLHAAFPNLQGYTEIFAPGLDLTTGSSPYTVNLPVGVDNSIISGHLVDQSSAPKLNLAGAIYGASDGGAFAVRRVNPVDASYAFNVAVSNLNGNGGTFWWLHAFVDPTSTFVVAHPRIQKVFIPYNGGAGMNVPNINFTVVKLDATISGKVTDPSSIGVPFATVIVSEQVTSPGTGFDRWVLADKIGNYSVTVPAGTYKVRADHFKWISPIPVITTVASGATATVNLQFRDFTATITGKVTYAGTPHPAMVRAWTADGAHTWAMAVQNLAGDYVYALRVNAGDAWHIQAVSEDGSDFLRSKVLAITPAPGLNKGNDLDLLKVSSLPGAVVFSFDSTQAQVLTLSDGSEVDIPANAMATAGTVTVIVRPLAELANDGVTAPVSFGYRLLAYDNFGTPIDHFNAAVTLVMPYTAAQLTALGVTPADLIPSYWDVGTNSFKPVDNYTVTQNTDGSGTLNLQVMHFTDYAVMYGTNPAFIQFNAYLPSVNN